MQAPKAKRPPRPRLPLFTGQSVDRVTVSPAKEFAVQVSVARLLDRFLTPGWAYSAFPAGELRTQKTGARLKASGAKAGWPDLILIDPDGIFHGLELKREGMGRLSAAQEAFHGHAAERGWRVAVADGYDAAVSILAGWGALRLKLKELV